MITSNISSLPEVAGSRLLVDPQDTAAIAAGKKTDNDPELRQSLATAGKNEPTPYLKATAQQTLAVLRRSSNGYARAIATNTAWLLGKFLVVILSLVMTAALARSLGVFHYGELTAAFITSQFLAWLTLDSFRF